MGAEQVMNFILQKLKEALLAVENFGGNVLTWFDKIFPPETRSGKIHHWIHVALPFVALTVALMVLFCLCRCICGRRSGGRMMRAPGKPSFRIPRGAFEADPKGYFRNLRGHPDLRWEQLCWIIGEWWSSLCFSLNYLPPTTFALLCSMLASCFIWFLVSIPSKPEEM